MLIDETNKEKILFSKCCDDWLNIKQNSVKESSYLNYKFKIEKHLKPVLGGKNIVELSQYDMNKFIQTKKEETDATGIQDIVIVLKSILRYIKKKYNIDYDLDFNSGLKFNLDEIEVFNEKEKQKLYRFLTNSNDIKTLGVLISLYSGLRIGEICGLKWEDIDFENKLIHVKRTVQRVYVGKDKESKVIITAPKTRKSARKIPISKVLQEKLMQFAPQYSKDCYIITGIPNKSAEPLTYRYTYKQVLIKCNIKYRKFHCLRHTFATRCIRVGMDIKSLSEVLGHSNIGITMNIYVHSSYEEKKKYIDKI
ncbi:MAG: site-specific integrase [Clostridia bacterium]|nr:site-specific integrase [Clostridia bacterium]